MQETAIEPKRIQRKRTKGWRMPKNTIYVGRPTKYSNPYKIGTDLNLTREQAVNLYRQYIEKAFDIDEIKEDLKGKNLACFCNENEACHADVLLEIANS